MWLFVSLCVAGAAQDQPPTLAQRVFESEDPAAFRAEIDTYQDYFLQRLFGPDPTEVADAREQLAVPLKPDATVPFRNVYTDSLASKLQRRLSGSPTFNQLNAAIVAERMARSTTNTRLAGLVRQLLEDDDASVALWGAKAAYAIFPDVVRNLPVRDRDPFVASLVAAAKRFPDNGPLAEEVFKTLSMRTTDRTPPPAEVLEAGAPVVTPAVQDLIAHRVTLYQPNAAAPSPLAEGPGLVFLTNNFVWPKQTTEQKARTAAVLRDLMLQAGSTAANLQPNGDDRVQVVELLKRIGSAFEGISGPVQQGGEPIYPDLNRYARTLRNSTPRPSQAVLAQYIADTSSGVEKAFPGLPKPD